ncbi:MAG: hypothetical protein PHV97_05350 [Candidatus Omnitrophica bacterium]|nr:hypothetical protein [Candidatus Omnitrophota bacterium]
MISAIGRKTRRFHSKGLTVAGWAREHGFTVGTVFAVLRQNTKYRGTNGPVGKKIHQALINDGFIRPTKRLMSKLGLKHDEKMA